MARLFTVPVNAVDQYGVLPDQPPHLLPLNAWTYARNIRFRDGSAEKFAGDTDTMGTPNTAPYWLLPVGTATTFWWLYAGLTKVGATDGSSHFDITRSVGGNYAATANESWTGVVLGGIPIINNGVDDPQAWTSVSGGTPLSLLSNWPANTKCNALRAYSNCLIAMDVTESSTRYPHLIRWSHPAEPGAVPSTWDYNDTAKDAGRRLIGDSGDFLVDGMSLGSIFILYKEASTYRMQYIGGQQIFSTLPLTQAAGMIAKRCAVEFKAGQHAVFSDSDFIIHDGNTVQSIADARLRQYVFNRIDSTYYKRSFAMHNKPAGEVWFAFPETGNSRPTLVAVWNYHQDKWSFRDFNRGFFAQPGIVDSTASSDAWSSDTATWDTDSSAWDTRLYNPTLRKPLIADAANTKLVLAESGVKFGSTSMTVTLERQALPLPISGRTDAPPDFASFKQFTRVLPQIEGTAGGVVQVQVGTKANLNTDTVWQEAKSFTIGSNAKIDCLGASGRLMSIRFTSSTDITWKLRGYEVEMLSRGKF